MVSKETTSVQTQEVAELCQTPSTSRTSGKAALPSPASRQGHAKPTVGFTPQLDHFRNPNWSLSHPSSNLRQLSSCSWSPSPVACHGCGLAFFVSLLNNSSCFQPVLNPPGNLTLPRRRVLLYVISRQQLWPRHPERGSLCRTVVSGMNFPSPPSHLFKGCWKRAVSLCTHNASSDFRQQLWGACPFALIAGYPQNLHNHLLYYFLFCILRDWTSHLPTEGALVFCIQFSRLWQITEKSLCPFLISRNIGQLCFLVVLLYKSGSETILNSRLLRLRSELPEKNAPPLFFF